MRIINKGVAIDVPSLKGVADRSDAVLLAANPGMEIKRYRKGSMNKRRLVGVPLPPVDYFAWTPVIAAVGGAVITDSGTKDFGKTGVEPSWDNAIYSNETFDGDFDLSWVVGDVTAATALAAIGVMDAIPVPNGSNFNQMDHGVYLQAGLAFRHVDNATPYDTYIQGIQLGDEMVIKRRGGDLTCENPGRGGSPLLIKSGVAGIAYRAVLWINRIGHVTNDMGFGPA